MLGFLKNHPGSSVFAVLGAFLTVGSKVNDAYSLINAGLPSQVWEAVGAAIFFAAVITVLYRWEQANPQLSVPTARKTLSAPLIAIIIFSVGLFGSVVWLVVSSRSSEKQSLNRLSTTALTTASPVKPATVVLNEENRRFREELRRFVLSDVESLVEASLGFFNTAPNDLQNATQNDRAISAIQRERNGALYFLFADARSNYDLNVKPLLDAANKPADQLDLDEIARKLKIYTKSYATDTEHFIHFVILSQAKLNADAEERWKSADERVNQSFRNLKTFSETANIMQNWYNTGVVPNGIYDHFRQRMRSLEAMDAK
jgi:hypothetical protein